MHLLSTKHIYNRIDVNRSTIFKINQNGLEENTVKSKSYAAKLSV